jgi:hypothetical protein
MHDFLQRAADHSFLSVKHTNSRRSEVWAGRLEMDDGWDWDEGFGWSVVIKPWRGFLDKR